MNKIIQYIIPLLLFFYADSAGAQTREELEKQRQQLKTEIEQTEKLLKDNKAKTKESLLQYNLISKKVNLQNQVIDNINKDVNMIDLNMRVISTDVRKYDLLLDTLKQEYAKSMVYAYKNRSSYDFLNFIFSASDFNDALKRISYLKSYRTYREMQGQNILRTQELRKKRMNDLNIVKGQKSNVLTEKNKEMETLALQQKEKDRIVSELKKQGAQLSKQIAAKQKQIQKVNTAITAAIKQAQQDAIKAQKTTAKTTTTTTKTTKTTKTTAPKPQESVLLNAENQILNNNFEKNKGSLPWPVDKGYVLMHYGSNTLHSGTVMNITSITISSDIGNAVKAVFDGEVIFVKQIDNMNMVVIQHGKYFTTYSNVTNVTVQKGNQVKTGQVIGKVGTYLDGSGTIDFYIQNESSNYDPEKWLKKK
jgi:septal ring factor EnvC (AmiA/AmiB activator)